MLRMPDELGWGETHYAKRHINSHCSSMKLMSPFFSLIAQKFHFFSVMGLTDDVRVLCLRKLPFRPCRCARGWLDSLCLSRTADDFLWDALSCGSHCSQPATLLHGNVNKHSTTVKNKTKSHLLTEGKCFSPSHWRHGPAAWASVQIPVHSQSNSEEGSAAAAPHKHAGLAYLKRKAATLQWRRLCGVKPPNPNDPLFFPARVSAQV